jgi:hypothetical protein
MDKLKLLFRGFKDKWIKGGYLEHEGEHYIIKINSGVLEKIKVLPGSVCQFTGVYDCDGTPIFVKDKIEICHDYDGEKVLYEAVVEDIRKFPSFGLNSSRRYIKVISREVVSYGD